VEDGLLVTARRKRSHRRRGSLGPACFLFYGRGRRGKGGRNDLSKVWGFWVLRSGEVRGRKKELGVWGGVAGEGRIKGEGGKGGRGGEGGS